MASTVPAYLCGVALSLVFLIAVHGDVEQRVCEQDIRSSQCETDLECLGCYNGSFCNAGTCNCTEDSPVFVSEKNEVAARCMPPVNFSGVCDENEQCLFFTEFTVCDSNKCVCQKEFFAPEGESICKREEPSPLVPIIVGSALAVTILLTLIIYFIRVRGSGGSTAGII